jgi:hypothetical protein
MPVSILNGMEIKTPRIRPGITVILTMGRWPTMGHITRNATRLCKKKRKFLVTFLIT